MALSGKMLKTAALVSLVIALTAGSAAAILGIGRYEKVKEVNGQVKIPLARVGDGKAHYYKYDAGGRVISFFVVKAGDGTIRSAFDACDVCYQEKKGYEQQGGAMVCRNCNRKFATDRIGPHASGGCNPAYLPHQEAGSGIVISVEDLKGGARFF